jgi:serine protease Do
MINKLRIFFIFIIVCINSAFAVELPDFAVLAEEQGSKVVNISASKEVVSNYHGGPSVQDERMQEFFKRFGIPGLPGMPPSGRGSQPPEKQSATGSGFIIDTKGFVITNAHVVADADLVTVKLADKREFEAKILGVDRRTDVALLKIKASNLPAVKFGDPEKVKVGQWVAAIGSPFGLENTMTVGVVSAKGRALPQETFVPFIQTDVAINPGNSGGPLFNTEGEVIGINSQIYSRTGGYMGLSFAIPIDVAINVAEQLKLNGKVIRGWLGIAIQEITKELSESFKMEDTKGALIANVEKGSPAEKGGLLSGDIILRFNKNVIVVSSDLPKYVGTTKPFTKVPVEIQRDGKKIVLNLAVGQMPTDARIAKTNKNDSKKVNRIGLALKQLSPDDMKKINGRNGLLVLSTQGKSIAAGIRPGDVILALNNSAVKTVASFNQKLRRIPKGKLIALLIYRKGDTLYVPIRITD